MWIVARGFVLTLMLAIGGGVLTYLFFSRLDRENPGIWADLEEKVRQNWFLAWLSRRGILYLFCFAYIIVFSWLLLEKHHTFNTGYDFAIYDQVMWNTLGGRLLETSITGLGETWLGTHFAPILLAVVPVYALWSAPEALLIFQTIALAVAAVPIFWVARQWLGVSLAAAITFCYFLFPAQEYTNLAEFHDVILVTPLLSFATYFLLKKRYAPLMVCLGLALLTKEDIVFTVMAVGLFIFLQGRRRLGLSVLLFGLVWAWVVFQIAIPYFAGTSGNFVVGLHYGAFGASLPEVLLSILTKPDLVLRTIWMPQKVEYVLHLLAPLAFLPLLGWPVSALALPTLAYLALTGDAASIGYRQYPAPMLAFLFWGTVLGLRSAMSSEWLRSSQRSAYWSALTSGVPYKAGFTGALLVAGISNYYLYAPGPLARHFDPSLYSMETGRQALANDLVAKIPADAAVLTTGGLAPHLTHRRHLAYLPFIDDYHKSEYLILDTQRCAWCPRELQPILASGYFDRVSEQNGLILAKRRPLEKSLDIEFDNAISLLGYTIVTAEPYRGSRPLTLTLGWRAEEILKERYVVQASLVDLRGHVWAQTGGEPLDGTLPTDRWEVGEFVGDQYVLRLPPTIPPDVYQITVNLHEPLSGRPLGATDRDGRSLGDDAVITSLRVEKDKSSITASQLIAQQQLDQPYFVDMGEIRLLGFKSLPKEASPGEPLSVGVYWRARGQPQGDYRVSIQLRDASGQVVYEKADQPAAGAYPTTEWQAGEVVLDWHDLDLPANLALGRHELYVLLTDPASGGILGEAELTWLILR